MGIGVYISFLQQLVCCTFLDPSHIRHCVYSCVVVRFFADMHGMLPATLLDIESEIIIMH